MNDETLLDLFFTNYLPNFQERWNGWSREDKDNFKRAAIAAHEKKLDWFPTNNAGIRIGRKGLEDQNAVVVLAIIDPNVDRPLLRWNCPGVVNNPRLPINGEVINVLEGDLANWPPPGIGNVPEVTRDGFWPKQYPPWQVNQPPQPPANTESSNVTPPNTMNTHNFILYGPPGTGKTYISVAVAVALKNPNNEVAKREFNAVREGQFPAPDADQDSRSAHLTEFNMGQSDGTIVFTTFHQSYAYEDFIEGVRVTTEGGAAKYAVRNGTLKRLARKALFHRIAAPQGNEAPNDIEDAAEKYSVTADNDLIRELEDQNGRVETLLRNLAMGQLPAKATWPTATVARRFVLVIDEINRGNISKIFGELITLIEDNKRTGSDEALSVTLPYSGETFTVPDNLYIVGTMNTADRSLATLDVALRRRFEFVEMMPQASFLQGILVDGIDMKQWLTALNKRIQATRGREFTIGHALFSELLVSNNIETLAAIMRRKILPLLDEYFFDDWRGIRQVLGDADGVENDINPQFVSADLTLQNILSARRSVLYKWNYEALNQAAAYTKLYALVGNQQAQNDGAG
jgi:5-methylcytosine-specific restriction protein B